jgi:hypothetical protein
MKDVWKESAEDDVWTSERELSGVQIKFDNEELKDLNFLASVLQFYNLLSDALRNSGHIASND